MLGAVLVVAGASLAAWAIRVAMRAPRPVSLAAALAAAVGLAAALAGATRLLVPAFF